MKKQIAILSLSFLTVLPAFAKKNVCTITANSAEEKELFQKYLNKDDFNFTELTTIGQNSGQPQENWFFNACNAGIKCDVLIISGHFGGAFYGSSGYSLGLNQMEYMSCQQRCSGILENPQEVFLMGCNTLASKDRDHRGPQEYIQALLASGYDAADAERIAAARYSPLGSSTLERMQRVFESVPMIYGYSSIGPLGKNVKPALAKYLKQVGDYEAHLNKIEGGERKNPLFFQNMKMFAIRTTQGVQRSSPLAIKKENVCQLSDEKIETTKKIKKSKKLLTEDFFTYFPAVSSFVRNTFPNPNIDVDTDDERAFPLIESFKRDKNLKSQVVKTFQSSAFGSTIQMDGLKFARQVGWLDNKIYLKEVRKIFINLLHKNDQTSVDTYCSLSTNYREEAILTKVRSQDLPKTITNMTLQMIGCGEEISADAELHILGHLKETKALHYTNPQLPSVINSIFRLKYSRDEVYSMLSDALLQTPSDASDHILYFDMTIPRFAKGQKLLSIYRNLIQKYPNIDQQLFLANVVRNNPEMDIETEVEVIEQLSNISKLGHHSFYEHIVHPEAVQIWLDSKVNNLDSVQTHYATEIMRGMSRKLVFNNSEMVTKLAFGIFIRVVNESETQVDANALHTNLYILQRSRLDDYMIGELAHFVGNIGGTSFYSNVVRAILLKHKDLLPEDQHHLLQGEKIFLRYDKSETRVRVAWDVVQ